MLNRKDRIGHRPFASGFTLVELLVVIAIIGILIGMLLPAVQQVREAARRSACMNQTRQMALAALNYESAHGALPSGAEHVSPDLPDPDDRRTNDGSSSGWGWRTKLLPFMEQTALFDQLDLTMALNSVDNREVVTQAVESFVCPTDPELADATHPLNGGIRTPMSSYLGNGGSIEWAFIPFEPFADGILTRSSNDRHRGVELSAITDGTSNTFFSGETLSYADKGGDRWNNFVWDPAFYAATAGSGASRTLSQIRTGHGELNPDWERTDLSDLELKTLLRNSYASNHPGGAVFVLVDGSTHFISDSIEHNQLTEAEWESGGTRGTYQRLFSRNDGLPVGDY